MASNVQINSETDAITEVCKIVGMAFHGIGDYSHACDCFCGEHKPTMWSFGYTNDGMVLDYVRQAVTEKLIRDGYNIPEEYK